MTNFTGTSGNDTRTGTTGDDTFDMSQGGDDIVSALDGSDVISMGGKLTALDSIDGGAGNDTVILSGKYNNQVAFGATTMVNVETLSVTAGFNYNIKTADATVAAGATLTVDSSAMTTGKFTFDGSLETNGKFVFTGGSGADNFTDGAGDDVISTGAGNDKANIGGGGNDVVNLGDGNDEIIVKGALTATDQIDGGAGNDTLTLNGNYAGLVFGATTMINVEQLRLRGGHTYSLTMNEANVTGSLLVQASELGTSDTLTFDGSGETSASFVVKAGSGNDTLVGGAGNDKFDLSLGGNDMVTGGGGNDTFAFGAALTASDRIDGGTGTDTVLLSGDYSAGLMLHTSFLTGVEIFALGVGYNYKIFDEDLFSNGLTIHADALGALDRLEFAGSSGGGGVYRVFGGAGDDTIATGSLADIIDISQGGNDIVFAMNGQDRIYAGGALTADDAIDGGANGDTVELNGDYSTPLLLGADTFQNIEVLVLDAGYDYAITMNDNTLHPGQGLIVNASSLALGNRLVLDTTAEVSSHSHYNVFAGSGDDIIGLGHGDDYVDIAKGGVDTISMGVGDDIISAGSTLTADDRLDGGSGNDELDLSGDYSAGLLLVGPMVQGIEKLMLGDGAYSLTTADSFVPRGKTLTIVNNRGTIFSFDGRAETDGSFVISGGLGTIAGGTRNDVISGTGTLNGGAGNDQITGGGTLNGDDGSDILVGTGVLNGGAGDDTLEGTSDFRGDVLTGGSGSDIFAFKDAHESSGIGYDTITDFQSGVDKIRVAVGVSSFSSAVNHSVSTATFDSDMAAVSVNLHRHEAMLFTVTSGDLAGQEFLLIGVDGVVGYQAGKDIVIALSNGANLVVSDIQTG